MNIGSARASNAGGVDNVGDKGTGDRRANASTDAASSGDPAAPVAEISRSDAFQEAGRDTEALCQAARTGDKHAFEALVLATYDRAFTVALNMLRSRADAKDVVQDAFIRVQRGLPDFQGQSKFTTWLYRVVVNLCLDQLRRRKKWKAVEPSDERDTIGALSDKRQGPDATASDAEMRKHLEAGLASLSEAHRAVFLLFEVEGLAYEEIAQVTGARVGTVMSRLFYARKKMQQYMEQHL